MGDKHAVGIDIIILADGVLHILEQHLAVFAAVLFADDHRAAVVVLHLDRGTQGKRVRAQHGDHGTAAARVHEIESLKHERSVRFLDHRAELFIDLFRGQTCVAHLRRLDREQSGAGRKVAGIHRIDSVGEFRRRQLAALVGDAKLGAEADMDDIVALFDIGSEKFDILADADRRGMRQLLGLVKDVVELLGSDVHPVLIALSADHDMQRHHDDPVAFFQFFV